MMLRTTLAYLRRRIPVFTWLPAYERKLLRPDLTAGMVLAALAVPQALGYAAIAGVPVQVGLYAVPVALVAYAIFGSSRQLVLGPVSTVSVMSGSLVAALAPKGVSQAVLYTTAVAVAAGIVLIIAAQLRIGWIAEFLSKPIVTGFVLGLTVLVIIGELPNLTGIPVSATDVLGRIQALALGLGETNPLTAAVGFGALAILMLGSRFLPNVPWSLVVLLVGLAASAVLFLPGRGVAVVGAVPAGLPGLQMPLIPANKIPDVLFAGAALGFVGLAEGLSAARLFAVKAGYRVDTDQELMAAGVGCLGSGLSGGLAVAGSLSKTAASDRSGGRTQVVGLTAAVLSVAVIVFLAPALSGLPKAVLSAIVVNAIWGLIDIPAMRRYRMTGNNDFVAAAAAAVGVLVAGPLLGMLFAVGLSVLGLVFRSSRVTVDVMGKVPGEKASWGALENHPERSTFDGVLVLRINESLFWVNATRAHDQILALVDKHPDRKALVLDLESSDQLDVTSADQLGLLLDQLHDRGVDLYLVHVRAPVRTVLRHTGVRARIGEDHIWHGISQGVRAARDQHGLRHGAATAPDPDPGAVLDAEVDEPEVIVVSTISEGDEATRDTRGR
jgi:high affinity sulfate transporter 1